MFTLRRDGSFDDSDDDNEAGVIGGVLGDIMAADGVTGLIVLVGGIWTGGIIFAVAAGAIGVIRLVFMGGDIGGIAFVAVAVGGLILREDVDDERSEAEAGTGGIITVEGIWDEFPK